jgi:hypothetical protein
MPRWSWELGTVELITKYLPKLGNQATAPRNRQGGVRLASRKIANPLTCQRNANRSLH